jgi:hypothetical protein
MTDSDSEPSEGGQPGNSNAEKHGIFADRQKLYDRLSAYEQELVVELATDLLKRYDGDVGAYEREAIRNVAVDTVKRWRYNEHTLSGDIMDETSERAREAYNQLAKRMTRELEQLGLLEDGPEMTKAEAQQDWMGQLSDAQDAVDDE